MTPRNSRRSPTSAAPRWVRWIRLTVSEIPSDATSRLLACHPVSFLCSVLEAVLLSITPSFRTIDPGATEVGKAMQSVKDRLDESLEHSHPQHFAHTMGRRVSVRRLSAFLAPGRDSDCGLVTLAILYFSEIIPKTRATWLAVPAAFRPVAGAVGVSTGVGVDAPDATARWPWGDHVRKFWRWPRYAQDGALKPQENEYLVNLLKLSDTQTEILHAHGSAYVGQATTVSKRSVRGLSPVHASVFQTPPTT